MQNDQLLDIYKRIKTEEDLEKFVKDYDYDREGLYVEYKEKDPKAEFSTTDKEGFSKNLTAFSNSEGGILIWGVKDKKNNEEDNRLSPIKDVNKFERILRSNLVEAIYPMIEGFEMQPILKQGSETDGYIKCFIRQSDITPHQAHDRKYYMRTVEGVLAMHHFQIADMFGKRQKPVLKLEFSSGNLDLTPESIDKNGYYPQFEIILHIRNTGRAIGRDVMLMIFGPDINRMKVDLDIKGAQVSSLAELYGGKQTVQLNFNSIFYPSFKTQIGRAIVRVNKDFLDKDTVKLEWKLFAENMTERSGVQSFFVPNKKIKGGHGA